MFRFTRSLAILIPALVAAELQAAPLGTSFTYQGQLKDGGVPANGVYDLRFGLFDVSSGGTALLTPTCRDNVNVVDGLFTVTLDFGAQFAGDQRFLEISVRAGGAIGNCASGSYTVLTQRQSLTATPYALYALNGPSAGTWQVNGSNIVNSNTGDVSIGTTSSPGKLTVLGAENADLSDSVLALISPGGSFGHIMQFDGNEINAWSGLNLNPHADTDILMVAGGGRVGIGTNSPTMQLDVNGRIHARQGSDVSAGVYFYQNGPAADRGFVGMRNDDQIGFYGPGGASWGFVMDVETGNVGVNTTAPAAQFHVNGAARVNVLEIVGADVAEKFPVSDAVKPGMVVMIDADHPGKLCASRGAYNRRVAGVVSGANDLPAGTVLGHLPGMDDAPPIALSGRVWVECDASEQAIEPGDLLTTAEKTGCAMKATDLARAQGAMIGKAMTGLPAGKSGLVLVLINLQ